MWTSFWSHVASFQFLNSSIEEDDGRSLQHSSWITLACKCITLSCYIRWQRFFIARGQMHHRFLIYSVIQLRSMHHSSLHLSSALHFPRNSPDSAASVLLAQQWRRPLFATRQTIKYENYRILCLQWPQQLWFLVNLQGNHSKSRLSS